MFSQSETRSVTPSFNGNALKLADNQTVYIQATFSSGDVVGTMGLQTSWTGAEASYVDVRKDDGTVVALAVTASSPIGIDDWDTAAQYVRPVWTYVSGTGTITIVLGSKDLAFTTRSQPAS